MTPKIAFLIVPALLLGTVSVAQAQEADQSAPSVVSPFYKIGVQHYDAAMMADLATRQDPIVVIPPNFVIPDAGFAPRPAQNALPNALPNAAPAAPANNRLPAGVQRIYALRADNSLVIKTTPDTQGKPFTFSPIFSSPIRQKGSRQ